MPRSNKKWCAHPVSHQGARKSGPGTLCPRGNRPIDNDLAAFITQEYYQADANVGFALSEGDLLCRTCYETESTRFHTHLAVEDAKSREYDGKHPRRSRSSFCSSVLAEVGIRSSFLTLIKDFLPFLTGWIHGIRSFHQFDPLAVNRINCRKTSSSSDTKTYTL